MINKKKTLWVPSKKRIENSNLIRFIEFINKKFNKNHIDYNQLHRWSIQNTDLFWESFWEFSELKYSKNYKKITIQSPLFYKTEWFPGAKLNFAENLLRFKDNRTAIIQKREGGETLRLTYKELYSKTALLAKSLKVAGLKTNDTVCGFLPNIKETVIAMLAVSSIGALWSSCSPDFGIKGVLDRFSQINPKIIFTADGYFYNGKQIDSLEKIKTITENLTSLKKVIVIPYINENPDINSICKSIKYDDFVLKEATTPNIDFAQLPFNHPLYIMYSSGTTGQPKCMVQSAAEVLINHLKELILHVDLKPHDKIFYYTTCGWMMWNWLVSSLFTGAALILFDGSPFYPNSGALFKLIEDEKINIFGISAKYISSVIKSNLKPKKTFNLKSLKTILSTGSPLLDDGFLFIYNHVKKDVCLSSISGGTDINGCFALTNPLGSVCSGKIQCIALGMDVKSFDKNGKHALNRCGELVCTKPFPSMPVFFWNDKNDIKYKNAYFNTYHNVWTHGDFIGINKKGSVVIPGRSDTTLNPGGIRIGTSEIYAQTDTFKEINDAVVVTQKIKDDERIILFVKLEKSQKLTDNLKKKIKDKIRINTTQRHVPALIIQIDDIPYTINMKKVEIAVKNIVNNRPVKNRDVLINPESLKLYKNLKELEKIK